MDHPRFKTTTAPHIVVVVAVVLVLHWRAEGVGGGSCNVDPSESRVDLSICHVRMCACMFW